MKINETANQGNRTFHEGKVIVFHVSAWLHVRFSVTYFPHLRIKKLSTYEIKQTGSFCIKETKTVALVSSDKQMKNGCSYPKHTPNSLTASQVCKNNSDCVSVRRNFQPNQICHLLI